MTTSPDRPLEPGELAGEYEIEARVGGGTYGDVYRAVQPMIGKRVAIKVLKGVYSAEPKIVSRFLAEARAVNAIGHPNIVDIFSFGHLEDGRAYHVMELLEGEALDQRLKQRGFLSVKEAIAILGPIGAALDAAHQRGILHRDLKPGNVFIAKDEPCERPKLLDFGVAKFLSDALPVHHKTATGTVVGTPEFMSPEQCRGPNVDHRTDIYAFGVMAYQMLTGTLPFTGTSVVEVLMKQVIETPPLPSSVRSDLPPEIDRAVMWMLAKDAEQRPLDLAAAMAAFLGRAPVPRRPKALVTRAATEPGVERDHDGDEVFPPTLPLAQRPNKTLPLAIAGLGALVIVSAAIAALLSRDRPPVVTPAPEPVVSPVVPAAPVVSSAPVVPDPPAAERHEATSEVIGQEKTEEKRRSQPARKKEKGIDDIEGFE